MSLRRMVSLPKILAVAACAVTLSAVPAAAGPTLVDFEPGVPAGWFDLLGGRRHRHRHRRTVPDADPLARPGQVGDNNVLEAVFDVGRRVRRVRPGPRPGGRAPGLDALRGPHPLVLRQQLRAAVPGRRSWTTAPTRARTPPSASTSTSPTTSPAGRSWSSPSPTSPGPPTSSRPAHRTTASPSPRCGAGRSCSSAGPRGPSTPTTSVSPAGSSTTSSRGWPRGTDGDGQPHRVLHLQRRRQRRLDRDDRRPAAPSCPARARANHVLQMDTSVVSGGFAGVIHAFENAAVDTWTPQDWSRYEGIRFWLYGNGTGSTLFLDVLDNRAPGSTSDTAERFSIDIPDDFSGLAALRDPLLRTAPQGGRQRRAQRRPHPHRGPRVGVGCLQQCRVLHELRRRRGAVRRGPGPRAQRQPVRGVLRRHRGRDRRRRGAAQPAPGRGGRPRSRSASPSPPRTEPPSPGGTTCRWRPCSPSLAGDPAEQTVDVITLDNDKHDGTRPSSCACSTRSTCPWAPIFQSRVNILDDDPFDPNLVDDFEDFPYLWGSTGNVILSQVTIPADDPMALPGQGAYEGVLERTGCRCAWRWTSRAGTATRARA